MSRRSRNAEPEQVTFEVTEGDDDAHFTQALTQTKFTFSQVGADASQFLDSARDAEKRKLDGIGAVARNKVVTDLSRILLFKGLAGACIDKTKVTAEALGDDMKGERIQGAILGEAEKRLRDVFGFGVRRVPVKMEEDLPSRFKSRLYLINDVTDNDDGLHSLNIHYADKNGSNEKGVLMMVLAFAFCKGTSQIRSGQMKVRTRSFYRPFPEGVHHIWERIIVIAKPKCCQTKPSNSNHRRLPSMPHNGPRDGRAPGRRRGGSPSTSSTPCCIASTRTSRASRRAPRGAGEGSPGRAWAGTRRAWGRPRTSTPS